MKFVLVVEHARVDVWMWQQARAAEFGLARLMTSSIHSALHMQLLQQVVSAQEF